MMLVAVVWGVSVGESLVAGGVVWGGMSVDGWGSNKRWLWLWLLFWLLML